MTGPVVVAVDEQDPPVDTARWQELARAALALEGVADGELNLMFVCSEAMAELNERHMGHTGPTDVLSFPIDGTGDPGPGARLLGDVVVCPDQARHQAPAHRQPGVHDGGLDDELALLIVHGVLHVLGHDHAEDDEALFMRSRERALLAALHRT